MVVDKETLRARFSRSGSSRENGRLMMRFSLEDLTSDRHRGRLYRELNNAQSDKPLFITSFSYNLLPYNM